MFGRDHPGLRRLAGRALPGHPGRQLVDRHLPGAAGEARARPARGPGRATGDGRARRPGRRGAGRPRSWSDDLVRVGRATRSSPTGSRLERRARAGRVHPHRRVAARSHRAAGRGGPIGLLRRRGRAAPTSSARSAPTATRSGSPARRASSGIRARRSSVRSTACCFVLVGRDDPARDDLRLRPLAARRSRPRGACRPRWPGVVTLVPEGLILLASLTYAVAALQHGPPGRAGPAAERDRVARLGGHDLPGQDRHADRGRRCASSASSRRRRNRRGGAATRSSAASRRSSPSAQPDPRGDRRRPAAGEAEAVEATSRSRRAGAGARLRLGATTYVLGAPELFPLGELAERRRARGARAAGWSPSGGRPGARLERDDDPPRGVELLGPGRARRGAAPGRACDGRVLPPRGRRAQGDLRRRALRPSRRSRSTPASRARRADRGRPSTGVGRRPAPCGPRGRGDRPDLARGQEAARRGAARPTAATWPWSATASTTFPRSRPRGSRSPRAAGRRWRAAWPTSCSSAATSPPCR